MKKLISILVVFLFAVSAMAQVTSQSGKLETVKSFRLGTCKLVKVEKEGAVTYQITALIANAASHELDIPLGDEKAAVALLTSLAEYKPTKGEIVNLTTSTEIRLLIPSSTERGRYTDAERHCTLQ